MRIIISLILLIVLNLTAVSQSPLKKRDTTISGPQTFGMIVGISKYQYIRPLAYADKDAELFRDFLKSPAGGKVHNDNIFFLVNEQADNANFWSKGFQWLKAKKLQQGDKLFIYLAGHGDAIDEDQFFFLGVDCNPGGDKNNYLVGGAIQLFNLKKKIANETAKGVDVFFIMDACRSNELPGGIAGLNFLNSAVTEKKAGEIIMLATGAGQESLEDASIGAGHGLFTYYLVDGLVGAADSMGIKDNKITLQELEKYVDKYVPSIAQSRFNRVQSPFFCCEEKKESIISNVDTAYLHNWLKTKKQTKGTGNSFTGLLKKKKEMIQVDTSLIETYNQFYKAVKENNFSGRSAAGAYYEMLNKKFPDDPYTLDAKTTLAAAYIKFAQNKMIQYLGCGNISTNQKTEFNEAGRRLETAIQLLAEDEPEFASSLLGRMFFLKASGEMSNSSDAFQNAYASLAIDKHAAYINNMLALLHLNNNKTDSAVYYAQKAIQVAPKWPCAYNTLSLTYSALQIPDSASKYKQKANAIDPSLEIAVSKKPLADGKNKIQFGIKVGGGTNNINISLSNWEQRNVNYADSLKSITTNNGNRIDVGIIFQINFSETFAWRPAATFSATTGEVIYERNPQSGVPGVEILNMKTNSMVVESPFIYNLRKGNNIPYLTFGPTFSFLMSRPSNFLAKLPLKSFELSGVAGIGMDIGFKQSNIILTPEFRYSAGLNSIKEDINNLYTNTLSSYKRQSFLFNLILRKK